MKIYTKKEKEYIIRTLIETLVSNGYDIMGTLKMYKYNMVDFEKAEMEIIRLRELHK